MITNVILYCKLRNWSSIVYGLGINMLDFVISRSATAIGLYNNDNINNIYFDVPDDMPCCVAKYIVYIYAIITDL